MDHDGVRACRRKGEGPFQRVLHALFQDQALNPGADHELLRPLGFLARPDLFAEVLNAVLGLDDLRAEEGILLQAGLVLNDHHGHAHPLQGADCIDKMLRQPAGVSVEDNGFGGHFHDIVDRPEPAGHIHQFNIRLSLGGGIAQGGDPHGVKLPGTAIFMHHGVFHDQAGQAVMGFHNRHQALGVHHLPQPAPADVRHRQFRPFPALEFFILLVPAVGKLRQPSAVGGQNGNHFVPDGLLEAGTPVIPVHHNVRAVFFQVLPVAERPLFHHPGNPRNVLKQAHTLRGGHQREPLVGSHRLIRQDADNQLAEPLRPADNGDVAAVDNIRGEAHIDRTVFNFLQLCGHSRQILRIVNFSTEQVLHVQGRDVRGSVQSVQGILRVNLCIARLAECDNLIQPDLPVFLVQLVQCLRFHGVVKNIYAHLHHPAVPDPGFEVLLRQGEGRGNSHAGNVRRQYFIKNFVLKNKITVHENNVIQQILSCTVNRINIVRLVVDRVLHKCEVQREVQGAAVIHQYPVIISGGDDHLCNPRVSNLFQLAGKNRFPG